MGSVDGGPAALAAKLSSLASALAESQDPATSAALQHQLVEEAKNVVDQYQSPFATFMDFTVAAYTNGAVVALIDIGVFDAVPPTGSISAKEIAEKCDADEELIIRLMRQMTCKNIFTEIKLHEWAHNHLSFNISEHDPNTQKWWLKIGLDEMAPPFYSFNHYTEKYGKKDVHTYTETPHSWHYNMTGSYFWQVLDSSPDRISRFNRSLSMFDGLHPIVAIFPFAEALKSGNSPSRVLAVDVGGGQGTALLELRTKCPHLEGSLVLQDRAIVLDGIPEGNLPGVTKMPHDFFTPQPVANAQIYYMRRVMHDWQDEDAAKILKAIKLAMGADSRVLIADMVLPEPATPQAAHAIWLDLMMMTIGGKERTLRDWVKLGELAGLRLVKVWQEPEKYGPLAVVEFVLPA